MGRLLMDTETKEIANTIAPVITREYYIKGTRYIVSATSKDGVNQDAAAIVRRLIKKDICESGKR